MWLLNGMNEQMIIKRQDPNSTHLYSSRCSAYSCCCNREKSVIFKPTLAHDPYVGIPVGSSHAPALSAHITRRLTVLHISLTLSSYCVSRDWKGQKAPEPNQTKKLQKLPTSMIIFHHFFYGYESETGDVVAPPPPYGPLYRTIYK
jgi:hypothetical protein